ncbi:ester cyclase [Alloyangia pacifica]|uniref:nuclear transport factor 2 family protein n=1 Tax=Alloyangia pacifica TaxID=311180 RepID=UPI001CD804CF|nr:ester cyclase [Alloyangia pacifica]MCA0995276.1 ester cyclase [Alloyangia pacifica]
MPFLAGFDTRWPDVATYLSALTGDLDEARRLDRLAEYLAPEVISHEGLGALVEPEVLGADLAARAAALSGAGLLPEERLWQATAQNAFVAAERCHVTARHDGAGLYGPPSRAPVQFTQMTERHCVAGQLHEQWVLRDEAAILRQIGVDVLEGARWRLVAAPRETCPPRYTARGNNSPWGAALTDLLERVMDGELAVMAKEYDPAAELFLPGAETGCGPREAETFWLGLRAAFPSARFEVDHALGAEDPLSPPRACLRWSLSGTHDGHGAFGAPTGAPVHILGMTQVEFGPDGLRREWTLYDVPGVWAQILRATGTA